MKDAETLQQKLNNNNRVSFTMVIPTDDLDDDDDDEHSYHFRGKPELLAGISEENLLEQLEVEYLGDITSCNNKVSCQWVILAPVYHCPFICGMIFAKIQSNQLE